MKFLPVILSLALITNASYANPFEPKPASGQVEIPNIGSGVGLINRQVDNWIAEKAYREIHKQLPIVNDLWLQDQIDDLFLRTAQAAKLENIVGAMLVKDTQINAFAVQGGIFVLNSGLIEAVRSQDELASVISHEVAHVTLRHHVRSKEQFKGQAMLALAGILIGSAVLSQTKQEDVGQFIIWGTQAATINNQLKYSREQESEADRIGINYLASAGYNPRSMASFFEVLLRSQPKTSIFPEFWLTHPLTEKRVSEAYLRANQLPEVKPKIIDPDFEILKLYTLVVSNQTTENQLQTLSNQKNTAAQLALSKFYLERGDFIKAQKNLDLVKEKLQYHVLIPIIQTDIYLGQNKLDQAYNSIAPLQMTMPENKAFSYKLAEVLLRQGKYAQVQTLVQRFINKNARDIQGWQLLQQAANLDKNSPLRAVNVLRYRAEAQYWSGSEEDAIKSMLHAQRLAKGNQAMSARIDSRLKQMQDERRMKI
ncbi:M48 family metalloprotease [Acinetobacter baumannii]|uniref:M48 family metalloprotease n=1 Tax=Acinetobacter baumannii TaxID=470 RepID=UPI000DE6928D|nr:M48 family metalloprotease [Acinetobacter baumannii]MDC4963248.1 M48 family metalloprotease [Acinetobacter baumannii]MDC5552561.1 M48 family metalloprotease [Acinetobacter baumannii]SSO50088.1 peptidase family M48 family protein [Acinetobacter baumannii]